MMNGSLLTPEIALALEGLEGFILSKYRVIERILGSGGVYAKQLNELLFFVSVLLRFFVLQLCVHSTFLHLCVRKMDMGIPLPLSSFVRESGTVTCIEKFFEEVPDVEICYKSHGTPAAKDPGLVGGSE